MLIGLSKATQKGMAMSAEYEEAAAPDTSSFVGSGWQSTLRADELSSRSRFALAAKAAEGAAVGGLAPADNALLPIIGCAGIDAEHRALLSQYQALLQTMVSGQNVDAFALSWYMIVRQAREHFAAEERAMREIGYEGYREHKAEHDKLLFSAEDFLKSVTIRFDKYDCMGVARFFRRWLLNHTHSYDRQFGEYILKRRPIALEAAD
jgi:hemerythrin